MVWIRKASNPVKGKTMAFSVDDSSVYYYYENGSIEGSLFKKKMHLEINNLIQDLIPQDEFIHIILGLVSMDSFRECPVSIETGEPIPEFDAADKT